MSWKLNGNYPLKSGPASKQSAGFDYSKNSNPSDAGPTLPNRRRSLLGRRGPNCGSNTFRDEISSSPNTGNSTADVDQALPHRRRSLLGRRGTNFLEEQLTKSIERSAKKEIYNSSDRTVTDNFNGFKKRLFNEVSVAKRLNMDSPSSDIIGSSSWTEEPAPADVTGICFMKDLQSTKKSLHNGQENRKDLASITSTTNLLNYNSKRNAIKKGVSPFKSNGIKIGRDSNSSSWLPNSNSVKNPTSPDRTVLKSYLQYNVMKTPPSPEFTRKKTEKLYSSISTPELPKLSILHDHKRRYSVVNNETSNSYQSTSNLNGTCSKNSLSESFNVKDKRSSSPLTRLYSSLQNLNVIDVNESDQANVLNKGLLFRGKQDDSEDKMQNCKPKVKSRMSNCFSNIRNERRIEYDLNNSLEAAVARSKSTYTVNETNVNVKLDETNSENVAVRNIREDSIVKSPTNLCSKPVYDRSPSFIVVSKSINITQDLNDSTAMFLYNESCMDQTMEAVSGSKYSPGINSTIKKDKKKLSTICEENTVEIKKEKECTQSINTTFCDDTNQVVSYGLNKTLVADTGKPTIHNMLSKVCDLTKRFETLKCDNDAFMKHYDEFVKNQNRGFLSALNAMNDLQNDLKSLIEDKENNFNSSNMFSDRTTLEYGKETASKSVYYTLKKDYSCLETPKLSTVKKHFDTSRKILTPHSMSMCVQDQVDQLFND